MRLVHQIVFIVLTTFAVQAADADFTVKKVGDSIVDSQALTIDGRFGRTINGKAFQQDAVATHGSYQYAGYYDGKRRVCIARRKLPSAAWEVIRFPDYEFRSNDAHNTISIGICPGDGTIHIAFDHHVDPVHYRVSRKGIATNPENVTWTASLFGPILAELEKGILEKGLPITITYPRFWQTPDGGLQFCYRRGGSGGGDRMLVDYDPATGMWKNTRQIDSWKGSFNDARDTSRARCSYPNGYDYGPDGKLHTTWTWREQTQGANHDIMYAYSEDRGTTWLNNAGEALQSPLHVNSPGIKVVNISRAYGLMNTQAQAVDYAGRIHTVMWHCTDASLQAVTAKYDGIWGPEDARRYHHYWRDAKGVWQHRELPGSSGNRPKLFFDKRDNAYLIFARKATAAKLVRDLNFIEGELVIMAATGKSGWTDWHMIHTEKGPFMNEMVGDFYRWKKSGVLSVMVQESPEEPNEATPLRILDFTIGPE